jgi:hypothetical protein
MKSTRLLYAIALGALSLFCQAPNGTIRGSLVSEGGLPISGAVVQYQRMTRSVPAGRRFVLAPGEVVASGRASSDSNGAFVTPELPAGEYILCVEHPCPVAP